MPVHDPQPGDSRQSAPRPTGGRFVAVLREHYVAGRLSLDELRRRVGMVLATGYADKAVAVIADLPPGGRQLSFRGPRLRPDGHPEDPAVRLWIWRNCWTYWIDLWRECLLPGDGPTAALQP